MDNFDEFEFKPITEGLGFHKKAQQMKKESSTLSSSFAGKNPPQAPANLKTNTSTKFSMNPGIQPNYTPTKPQAPLKKNPTAPIQEKTSIQYQMPEADTLEIKQPTHIIEPSEKNPTAIVIHAILFDGLVVFGLTGLFAFVVLLVAKVDPLTIVYMLSRDWMTAVSMGVLVFAVTELYMIVSRSFFGSTLGEWAFDTELGSRQQQLSALYPLQVVIRTFVNVITGFIFFPAVAALSGVDLAGKISGLYLRRG
ncbi:MAG: RDD family protein [Bdellovibrionales bacterium]